MNNKYALCFLLLLSLLYSGCVKRRYYLYYGNFSHSYYEMEKNHDEKSLANFKQELENIVKKSDLYGLKVPPGVNLYLGNIAYQEEQYQAADGYWQKEISTWPESNTFVNYYRQRYMPIPTQEVQK